MTSTTTTKMLRLALMMGASISCVHAMDSGPKPPTTPSTGVNNSDQGRLNPEAASSPKPAPSNVRKWFRGLEIYSKSRDQWFQGISFEIKNHPGGQEALWVEFDDSQGRSNKIKKLVMSSIAGEIDLQQLRNEFAARKAWKPSSRLKIFSESGNQWCEGKVLSIFHDVKDGREWLEVKYNQGRTKEVRRMSLQFARPLLKTINCSDRGETTTPENHVFDVNVIAGSTFPSVELKRFQFRGSFLHQLVGTYWYNPKSDCKRTHFTETETLEGFTLTGLHCRSSGYTNNSKKGETLMFLKDGSGTRFDEFKNRCKQWAEHDVLDRRRLLKQRVPGWKPSDDMTRSKSLSERESACH